MIKVSFAAHLPRTLGAREAQVEASTVRGLLRALSKRHGKPFDDAVGSCKVIVNGTNVAFLKGEGTALADGDEVVLLPPLAGG
ncbi:MAG: MoaD/ThiS family protein [Deltaproteobacteria bacterium]|nr:MoaD/ThiS family protein [Deltaproteobacteria bacterium]